MVFSLVLEVETAIPTSQFQDKLNIRYSGLQFHGEEITNSGSEVSEDDADEGAVRRLRDTGRPRCREGSGGFSV